MRQSAGILLYKKTAGVIEVFLVHPGGPYWKSKEAGAWTIPKGEFAEPETALEAAQREFEEETGQAVKGPFLELTPVKQKGGKIVFAFASPGDIDPATIVSNSFRQEWPYRSGRWQVFPEIDKAGWFSIKEAREKINVAQTAFLDELRSFVH